MRRARAADSANGVDALPSVSPSLPLHGHPSTNFPW